MLNLSITTPRQVRQIEHADGPLEIGRGPRVIHPRLTLDDPYLSRDHLRIEELSARRLRVENLSRTNAILLADGGTIDVKTVREFELPLTLRIGELAIEVDARDAAATDSWQRDLARTALDPWSMSSRTEAIPKLRDLGATPSAERLAQWFERLLAVQRAAAGSAEFYGEAARAMVELIGLDRGCVLLLRGTDWDVTAEHTTRPGLDRRFSRGVMKEVVEKKKTLYRAVDQSDPRSSLLGIEAVVSSPILDSSGEVLGVLYGTRSQDLDSQTIAISPLEAQVVQLLAAAVGAGLARQEREAETARVRVQFEQFFSTELVRELERDPSLLEARDRELTILFADLCGFSGISERLGSRETFRLMRDVMDCLTASIAEQGGAVIDYYGDGVAVMWNAPAEQPGHAALACRAALAMQREIPGLNGVWAARLGAPLQLGIGIHTGLAQVGNSGSSRRLKYGPRGHAVNLASRVESATRHLGGPILLTGATAEQLEGEFELRRVCPARLPGVKEIVTLFELPDQPPSAEWLAYRQQAEGALSRFEAGDWTAALAAFHRLAETAQGQRDPALAHLVRAAGDLARIAAAPADAVVELATK
ncbi:MAG: hypothetical protein JNG90_06775 [Planctomycetaceae bacterium]|nr:hypothetical protein [Planctomycetaceae bacterium]